MRIVAEGPRGAQSLRLRTVLTGIVRHVAPRDQLSLIGAILYWINPRFRFLSDPLDVELVRDPEAILDEIETHGFFSGDCDCIATFLLACMRSLGIKAKFVRAGFASFGPLKSKYTHVFVAARDQYGRWVAMDPVAGKNTKKMLGSIKLLAYG